MTEAWLIKSPISDRFNLQSRSRPRGQRGETEISSPPITWSVPLATGPHPSGAINIDSGVVERDSL